MPSYQVVTKKIVSSDGKIIAEAKSIVTASGNGESEISQSVSVDASSGSISSCSVKSSSSRS
jgi:hypothetical protein